MGEFFNTFFFKYWKALSYLKEEKGRGWEQQYWFYQKNTSNTIKAQEQWEERVGKIPQLLDPSGKCNCVASPIPDLAEISSVTSSISLRLPLLNSSLYLGICPHATPGINTLCPSVACKLRPTHALPRAGSLQSNWASSQRNFHLFGREHWAEFDFPFWFGLPTGKSLVLALVPDGIASCSA